MQERDEPSETEISTISAAPVAGTLRFSTVVGGPDDRLVITAPGGRLLYDGPAVSHFRIEGDRLVAEDYATVTGEPRAEIDR
jgi:hypothetical protein